MSTLRNSGITAVVLRLFFVIGVVTIMYYGANLLLPIVVAGLLALLLNPLDEWLLGRGWPHWASVSVCMVTLLLFFGGLFFAIGQQAMSFSQNWGQIEERVTEHLATVTEKFPMLKGMVPSSGGGGGEVGQGGSTTTGIAQQLPINGTKAASLLSGTLGILGDFLLMLVYTVLFLTQKDRLREFILRRMPDEERGTTHQTLNESRDIVQKYLKGRFILIVFLAIVYGIGFGLAGLDYAILMAVLVAVLSIIPYLGNIIGAALVFAVAIAGGGGTTMLLAILGTMAVGQVLESYILLPLVVGDEVDINPLTTIIGVMAFTVVWGPVGAIVSIPILAMLRIVCSHVEGLEDYAYLLGQE